MRCRRGRLPPPWPCGVIGRPLSLPPYVERSFGRCASEISSSPIVGGAAPLSAVRPQRMCGHRVPCTMSMPATRLGHACGRDQRTETGDVVRGLTEDDDPSSRAEAAPASMAEGRDCL